MPKLAQAQIEGGLALAQGGLVAGNVAVVVHVVHPGARDLLEDRHGERRRAGKRRVDLVQQLGDHVQVVVGHLDQGRQELHEADQAGPVLEPHRLEPTECHRDRVGVVVDLPFQRDRLLGHHLHPVLVILVADEAPTCRRRGVQKVHRNAGKDGIGDHRDGRIVVGSVQDLHPGIAQTGVDVQLRVDLGTAAQGVVVRAA